MFSCWEGHRHAWWMFCDVLRNRILSDVTVQAGYGTTYSTCEHATNDWKALTAPANTTSNAARANANKPCTACPSAS